MNSTDLTVMFMGIFLVALFFLFLVVIEKRKLKKLRKNYNEEEDKSRSGSETRGRVSRFAERKRESERVYQSPGQDVLPTTNTNSVKPNRRRSRGIFGKRRRRR